MRTGTHTCLGDRPRTLVEALAWASRSASRVRFETRDGVQSHSYREILERATGVAGGLGAAGVPAGGRVALALPTGIEFYDGFFGALGAGAVPVALPLPPRFGSREAYVEATSAMLSAAGAELVLVRRRDRASLAQAAREMDRPARCLELPELPRVASELATPGPDDLAVAQFSSGTTASPKAVALTHRQLLANVDAILDVILEAHPESEAGGLRHAGVSWLPLHHDMGLVGAVLTALCRPGPLTLLAPELFIASPARWLRAISEQRATISAAPNFALDLCVERVRDEHMEGVDLASWLVALNGSETVVPDTMERFYERFRRYGLRREALTPVYGLAEASLAITFSSLTAPFRAASFDRDALVGRGVARRAPASHPSSVRLASAGRPLSGFSVRIANEDGEALPENRMGRVRVRGPSIAGRYLVGSGSGESPLAADGGWLDTGDRGFLHDGELFLAGRDSDRIVLHGSNYAPEMFESALDGLEDVHPRNVAALGGLGERGDVLNVLVETRRFGDEAAMAALERTVRGRLSERAGVSPERVVFLAPGSLPRTSSGKIRRAEASRRFLRDVVGPVRLTARSRRAAGRRDPGL